jgi:uncharacterized membrane protein
MGARGWRPFAVRCVWSRGIHFNCTQTSQSMRSECRRASRAAPTCKHVTGSTMRPPSEKALRRAAGIVAALGIGVATYITIAESGGGAPACLAGGGGCETVASSTYSDIAGLNVAVFGIVGYVLLLGAALLRGDDGRIVGFALALTGFGFSAYLTYLELFVIEAICQWCVASAVLMTVLFALNTTRAFGYVGKAARVPNRLGPREGEDDFEQQAGA